MAKGFIVELERKLPFEMEIEDVLKSEYELIRRFLYTELNNRGALTAIIVKQISSSNFTKELNGISFQSSLIFLPRLFPLLVFRDLRRISQSIFIEGNSPSHLLN